MIKQISKIELKNFRNEVLVKYKKEDSPLMQVLQEAQAIFGYIPIVIQETIGAYLHIPTARIHGVVSFYSMFSTVPLGKYSVGTCMGTACYVRGGERLLDRVMDLTDTKYGETSEDGMFTLAPTRCVGDCSNAPVIMVNDRIHTNVTSDDVEKIINEYRLK